MELAFSVGDWQEDINSVTTSCTFFKATGSGRLCRLRIPMCFLPAPPPTSSEQLHSPLYAFLFLHLHAISDSLGLLSCCYAP